LVDAMAQQGYFASGFHVVWAGRKTDPMTLVRVVEEVSRADGAAAERLLMDVAEI